MRDTVHLAELRCDGSAHGGCQTGCRFFWQEDWLVRDPSDEPVTAASVPAPAVVGPSRAGATIETLQRATTVDSNDGVTHYSCQATHVRAATSSLSPFDVRQYMHDVTSGNEPLRKVIPQLAISLFNKYQDVSRHRLPPRLRIRGGMRYPFIVLDNVVCDADFHRFCPRGMYPFWREIWLRKVDE